MSNQHGIRAVPSEGTRFRATSNQLNKDNYTQWSRRLKGILVVNKVWDLVSERRSCPARPRAYSRRDNDENPYPEDIAANKIAADKYDAYEEDYNKAACLLVESISDSQLCPRRSHCNMEQTSTEVCKQVGDGKICSTKSTS